jgi:exocyst complex component 7
MLEYQDIIENVLKTIYFKYDKEIVNDHLEHYIQQILEAVETNIRAKKEEYKDIALSHLFMLNNHNYIMKKLKNPDFTGVSYDSKMILSHKKICEKDEDNYIMATWSKALDQLKECNIPTQKLGMFQKNDLKKKFKVRFHVNSVLELF